MLTALSPAELLTMDQAGEKVGACAYCGRDDGPVFKDNDLCEDCDNDSVHCTVCDERQFVDGRCRHVFRDEDFIWCGAGCDPSPSSHIKRSVIALVRLMPGSFPYRLRRAITDGSFYTWLIAPLIGSGGLLELNGCDPMPYGDYFGYGNRLMRIGSGHAAEDTADGYHWLASLYKHDTFEANQTTIRWLQEYILRPHHRRNPQ